MKAGRLEPDYHPRLAMALRGPIEHLLIPALESAGFSEASGEYIGQHTLRRRVEQQDQIISIERRGDWYFRFHLTLSSVCVDLPLDAKVPIGHVQRKRGESMHHWFCARPTLLDRLSGKTEDECANRAVLASIELLPEIESWWQEQKPSRHIENVLVPVYGK